MAGAAHSPATAAGIVPGLPVSAPVASGARPRRRAGRQGTDHRAMWQLRRPVRPP